MQRCQKWENCMWKGGSEWELSVLSVQLFNKFKTKNKVHNLKKKSIKKEEHFPFSPNVFSYFHYL